MGFAKTKKGRAARRRHKKRSQLRRRAAEACLRSAVDLACVRIAPGVCDYPVRMEGIRGWRDGVNKITPWSALSEQEVEILLRGEFTPVSPLRSPLEVLALLEAEFEVA